MYRMREKAFSERKKPVPERPGNPLGRCSPTVVHQTMLSLIVLFFDQKCSCYIHKNLHSQKCKYTLYSKNKSYQGISRHCIIYRPKIWHYIFSLTNQQWLQQSHFVGEKYHSLENQVKCIACDYYFFFHVYRVCIFKVYCSVFCSYNTRHIKQYSITPFSQLYIYGMYTPFIHLYTAAGSLKKNPDRSPITQCSTKSVEKNCE